MPGAVTMVENGLIPASLKGLKPGEIGLLIVGRVMMGDIAVTLVDLAARGLLQVEAVDGTDWLLRPDRGAPALRAIAKHEKKLLEELADRGQTARLSSLAADFGDDLGKVRDALEHETVAKGWVRHLHHDERTPAGEELAEHLRAFRRDLRRRKSDGGEEAVGGALLPFALRFGLVSGDQMPLARFAHAWVRAFGDLPGWRPVRPPRGEFNDDDLNDPWPVSWNMGLPDGRW